MPRAVVVNPFSRSQGYILLLLVHPLKNQRSSNSIENNILILPFLQTKNPTNVGLHDIDGIPITE